MNISKRLALILATMMIFTACKSTTNNSSSQALVITQATTESTAEPTSSNVNDTTSTQAPVSNEIGADEFKDTEYLNLLKQMSDKVDIEVVDFSDEFENPICGEGIYDFIGKYSWLFNEIPIFARGSIDIKDIEKWYNTFPQKNMSDKISENPNLYTFYRDFNLTWEDVKEKAMWYKQFNIENDGHRSNYLDEEEYLLIFNGTEEEIAEYFTYEKAVAVEDRVYSVMWLYEHDLGDYVEAGITPEKVNSKVAIYKENFTDEFADGLLKKIDAYNKLCTDVFDSYKKGERDFDIEKWIDENL